MQIPALAQAMRNFAGALAAPGLSRSAINAIRNAAKMVLVDAARLLAPRISTTATDHSQQAQFSDENWAIGPDSVMNLYRKSGVKGPLGIPARDDRLLGWLPDRERQLKEAAFAKGEIIIASGLFISSRNSDIRAPAGIAEKFKNSGEPVAAVVSTAVSDRKETAGPQDRYARPFTGKAEPPVVQRQGEYAGLIDTPEFKKWFGESKVVFKPGELDYFQNPRAISDVPRMVYHGTNADIGFDIFRQDERGAIWFRSDRTAAGRLAGRESAVVPAFLKMENPFEPAPTDSLTMGTAIDKAKACGNDGVILDLGNGDYIYTVFSLDQVKSPLIGAPFNTGEIEVSGEPEHGYAENCREAQKGFEPQSGRKSRSCHCMPASAIDLDDATIGKQFQQIEKKPVQIIGLRVKNYADLAVLAQGWRNPNYEELRYVFVSRGIIVDHERVTCMHPGYSKAYLGDDFGQYIEHLKERIRALDATAVYMVHNHPNGNPEPSDADVWASAAIAMSIPQYRGHIIINSRKYGYIDSTVSDPVVKRLPKLPQDWADPILQPSVPHELLGSKADTIENIATWAKSLTLNRDAPVLIYIDPDGKVRGLQEIHARNFTNIALIRNRMPQKLVDFGSIGAIAVLPEKTTQRMLDAVRYYVQAHVFRDAIGFDGASAYYFGRGETDLEYFGGILRGKMSHRPAW